MTGLPPSHGEFVRLQRIHRVNVQARPHKLSLAAALMLALTLPLSFAAAPSGAAPTPPPSAQSGPSADDPGDLGSPPPGRRWRHSSDGVRGEIAPVIDASRRTPVTKTVRETFQVVPGVGVKVWDQRDARGKIRAYLTTVRLNKPGVRMGYLSGRHVPDRLPVSDLVSRNKAVVGVNGDFFDIGDTGAPLGYAASASRPMLAAPRYGWPKTFQVSEKGKPDIGDAATVARLDGRKIGLSNVNPPTVPSGGIALYTPQWGETMGARVTSGQRKNVREVVIKGGKVISNKSTLSKGADIDGRVLIARGKGPARNLAGELPVGEKVGITRYIEGNPDVAIGGSTYLMLDGEIVTKDDGEMHPRTAVGIDRDHNRVLLLVIDGRQRFSRGYTMLELAQMMKQLGAEEALNLDGGGSTTLVAKRESGHDLVNSPSDGQQRLVPNGLGVFYDPPTGKKKKRN